MTESVHPLSTPLTIKAEPGIRQAPPPASGLSASSEVVRRVHVSLAALRIHLDRAATTASAANCIATTRDREFDRDDAARLFDMVFEMVCGAMSAAGELEDTVSSTVHVDPVEASRG